MIYTIHVAPKVETFYFYSNTCTYDNLDEWVALCTATYTHEGEHVYLSGLAKNPAASSDIRLSIAVLRNGIKQVMAAKGVFRISYRRRKKVRHFNLI